MRSPLSLLFSRLKSPMCLSLSTCEMSQSLEDFVNLHWTLSNMSMSVILESPDLDTVPWIQSSPVPLLEAESAKAGCLGLH